VKAAIDTEKKLFFHFVLEAFWYCAAAGVGKNFLLALVATAATTTAAAAAAA
jgi:hypothetical protein